MYRNRPSSQSSSLVRPSNTCHQCNRCFTFRVIVQMQAQGTCSHQGRLVHRGDAFSAGLCDVIYRGWAVFNRIRCGVAGVLRYMANIQAPRLAHDINRPCSAVMWISLTCRACWTRCSLQSTATTICPQWLLDTAVPVLGYEAWVKDGCFGAGQGGLTLDIVQRQWCRAPSSTAQPMHFTACHHRSAPSLHRFALLRQIVVMDQGIAGGLPAAALMHRRGGLASP
jgi:hypothetical protein